MKRLTSAVLGLLLGTCLVGAGPKGGPRKGRLSSDLKAAQACVDRDQRVQVVVNLTRGRAGRVVREVSALGGVVQATYRSLDQMSLDVPIGLLDELVRIEGVEFVAPDRPVIGVASHLQTTTGANLVQMPVVPGKSGQRTDDFDGSGITIGVVDSGIDLDHFDLRDGGRRRVLLRVDFTGDTGAIDPFGHGTHVAGIIAGDGSSFSADGRDFSGIAPGSSLIDLRVLDDQGRGTLSRVIAAIDWAIVNRNALQLRVLNLSLAAPPVDSYRDDPLCRAVERAERAGIVVVAAAGNFGLDAEGRRLYGGITSPGISPSAITVGASDTRGTDARSDDAVAPWSSRGPTWAQRVNPETGETVHDGLPKPDLVAPGVRLISLERPDNLIVQTYPELHVDTRGGHRGPYMLLSGTSMSAPVVAGAAALMLQVNPGLAPKQVKALLMYSAQVLDGNDLFEQGAGLVNIEGAVRLARVLIAEESLPTGASQVLPENLIAGERVAWSQGLIWGRGLALGFAALDPDQEAYAQGLIWGIRRGVFSADVPWVEGTFSDGLVAVGQGDSWQGLLDGPAAAWQTDLMPDTFFTLDASGLIWGYRRWFIGDGSLIWGLRRFRW